MRKAPELKHSQRFYDCAFLCSGFDTLEESASVYVLPEVWERLEDAKQYAREHNTGSNQAYTTKLGGIEFQIKPHGGDGVAFILSNNLFTVKIRPAKIAYNLSVSFRSRTLWEYGVNNARKMLWDALLSELKPRKPPDEGKENEDAELIWRKISRVDYAFDFHAPELTQEIGPDILDRFVCHSSCKVRWDFKTNDNEDAYIMGTSSRIQTLTVGKKKSLQIQLYQKSDEITEKSQKTWMYKLWSQAGYKGREDVWRIELRFSRDYLKERGIYEFEDFEVNQEKLLCEALKSRRLCDRTSDSNRRRWPVHPMWSQAIDMAGNAMVLLSLDGHREQSVSALTDKIKQDVKAALRRYSVLEVGSQDFDWLLVRDLLMELQQEIEEDESHELKMEEYAERYKYISEPL